MMLYCRVSNDIIKPFKKYNPILGNRSGTSVILFELPNFIFLNTNILDLTQTIDYIKEVKKTFDITTAST